ncbi:MAG: sigma-70 family RNA polymerase sigma factor [Bacteroidetes bacterium]|nr:sigma-70 family RNA polymerase sigma factor [Bacteroidota bacterium]
MAEFLQYISEVKKNGSTVAFHQLVKLFEYQVFTMCLRIIGNREEAEEAAQDVFLKCYRNIDKLKDPEKFPQWLLKIAYSKSIDYVRRKKMQKVNIEDVKEIEGDVNERSVPGNLNNSEVLEAALTRLDPENKAIINLYYQENMSVKEIAQLMEWTESNVKIRLHRSRGEIRRMIEAKSDIKREEEN